MNRLGLYFFALASILSILDGFIVIFKPELLMAKHILLVFSGIVLGMFILSNEKQFMISGIAYIVSAPILLNTLGYYFSYSPIGRIVLNFLLFISAATITLGFREFVDVISKEAGVENLHHELTLEHLNKKSFNMIWSYVILVAVALSIAMLLIEMFYDITEYEVIFAFLDVTIVSLFIVDLWILFEKAKTMKEFLTRNFTDMLAAIPSVGFLRFFKIIRAVRLVRMLNGVNRFSKFVKVSRTTKFFSDDSAVAIHTKKTLPAFDIKDNEDKKNIKNNVKKLVVKSEKNISVKKPVVNKKISVKKTATKTKSPVKKTKKTSKNKTNIKNKKSSKSR